MARDDERLVRSQEEPIVGGLPDVPGINLHLLVDLRSDHPAGELLIRHLPRTSRDFWSPLGGGRAPYGGPAHLVDVSEAERLRGGSGTYLAGAQQRLTTEATGEPEVIERLAALERLLANHLSAVEFALAGPSGEPRTICSRSRSASI